jgi:two-component system sensor histidine kinase ChiS
MQSILIVDDDFAMRRLSRAALSRSGFQVLEAEHGRAALETIRDNKTDVVLLDVDQPILDGFATCAELRRSPRDRYLPIIMMTDKDDMDSVNRAYEAGVLICAQY